MGTMVIFVALFTLTQRRNVILIFSREMMKSLANFCVPEGLVSIWFCLGLGKPNYDAVSTFSLGSNTYVSLLVLPKDFVLILLRRFVCF